ncbi:LemA family protein [Pinibacter soli]|uniref:LemA family protein n=1 Tax=Pinibacter soli TaxID=3044211 RepID=A0ABT6R8P7_9BACT|nr:LemA family protein [Pinibacter soli]MDI3318257.1 LemA family protein [Pinibacter soli]
MSTNKLILVVIIGLIVLLVGCGGCGAINFQKNAVTMDENVKGKWGNVQNQYQRRSDLIPNLVNTVKGAANFEQETLTKVIEARAKATSVQINANDLSPEKVAQFQQAQGELSGALSRLLVTVEQYPDLKANKNYQDLQAELAGTENRIAVARRDFNEAVQGYNSSIRTFPNNFYAGWFGFKSKGYFEATPGSDKAPEVKF